MKNEKLSSSLKQLEKLKPVEIDQLRDEKRKEGSKLCNTQKLHSK